MATRHSFNQPFGSELPKIIADLGQGGGHVGNLIWTVSVSRADVADFMIEQLASSAYLRTAVGVA